MLGDPCARRGGDEHRRGGNIEALRTIATGTHDVDKMIVGRRIDLGRQLAHHPRRAGDLADGFLFHSQPCHDRRRHQRAYLPVHDLAHQIDHFVVENLAVFDGALKRFLRRDRHALDPS
jgi:hypothetical protein